LMRPLSLSRIAKGEAADGRWLVNFWEVIHGVGWRRNGTAGIAVGGVRPQLGRRGRFCWRARVRCGRVHGKLSMPAMMLPFAERSASGHPPCGWGVSGALINEGALTWGPDGSGSIEGAGDLLALEEKPGSTTGRSRLAECKENHGLNGNLCGVKVMRTSCPAGRERTGSVYGMPRS
jgi:hypothetical protein